MKRNNHTRHFVFRPKQKLKKVKGLQRHHLNLDHFDDTPKNKIYVTRRDHGRWHAVTNQLCAEKTDRIEMMDLLLEEIPVNDLLVILESVMSEFVGRGYIGGGRC